MGFFDFLQPKPRCASCQDRIYDDQLEWQGNIVCVDCYAVEKAQFDELEKRRIEEEEALARVQGRQMFGPRSDAR